MIGKYFLSFLIIVSILSCKKAKQESTYIVNASKMIGLKGNSWINVEPQLNNSTGYHYTATPANSGVQAAVSLLAIDDSNRTVNGTILLNIAIDRVQFTRFNTDPMVQSAAYAMMLNYNSGTLQSLIGITSSLGGVIENSLGRNVPVNVILSKLINGQVAEQLTITYYCAQGEFTMGIYKQNDGRFVFSYRGD